MTDSTATVACCSAANTMTRLMPNSAPASQVRRSRFQLMRPPVA